MDEYLKENKTSSFGVTFDGRNEFCIKERGGYLTICDCGFMGECNCPRYCSINTDKGDLDVYYLLRKLLDEKILVTNKICYKRDTELIALINEQKEHLDLMYVDDFVSYHKLKRSKVNSVTDILVSPFLISEFPAIETTDSKYRGKCVGYTTRSFKILLNTDNVNEKYYTSNIYCVRLYGEWYDKKLLA